MLSAFKDQPAKQDVNDFCVYASHNPWSGVRMGGPNAPLALTANDIYRSQFGSWHPNVVPVLFGDSSTPMLSTSMSSTMLGLMCGSREGGVVEF